MTRHRQVTECRRGGPVSKHCTCEHCTLDVCAVCGSSEGSLTTDCPGEEVSFDKQQEIYETNLDFSAERGWHQGKPTQRRSPRFEKDHPPATEPHVATPAFCDRRWLVGRSASDDLAQKAIAWVLADRLANDHSTTLTRIEDEIDALNGREPDDPSREWLNKLEHEQVGFRLSFRLADQRAQQCDDEFRQAARKLVADLEQGSTLVLTISAESAGKHG